MPGFRFLAEGGPFAVIVKGDHMDIFKAIDQVRTFCDQGSPGSPDHGAGAGKDPADMTEVLKVQIQVGGWR